MTKQTVYVEGRRVRVQAKHLLGQGGEAEVFEISRGRALKLFKGPEHPEYAGQPQAQAAAKLRLELHQQKLRNFPQNLPEVVVAPEALAFDRKQTKVVGYTMRKVDGAQALHRFGSRAIRRQGVDDRQVTQLLLDLHDAVKNVHACGVTIGDFNDLNVLVGTGGLALIDADSFQFGSFACPVFSERFLDPLRCELQADQWVTVARANPWSDWYAYACMLMQCLLWVGPYGGIYRPQEAAERCPASLRPARRLTVFHPEVCYPRPARPWTILPDDLCDVLRAWFVDDARGEFPRAPIEQLSWTRCPGCGLEHARARCPGCRPTPAIAKPQNRHQLVARVRFETHGLIVHTQVIHGKLAVVAHVDGEFVRESGQAIMRGDLAAELVFAQTPKATWVGRGGRWVCLETPRAALAVAAGRFGSGLVAVGETIYSCQGGVLERCPATDPSMRESVGTIVDGQTGLFAGQTRGLALFCLGRVRGAFLFANGRSGLTEVSGLTLASGQLLQVHVTFGQLHTWLICAWAHRGGITHVCECIDARGQVIAHTKATAGDGSWLGSIGGQAAVADVLFAPTDGGVVRVGSSLVVQRTFPQTAPWVDSASVLQISQKGLHAVSSHKIIDLSLTTTGASTV